MLVLGFELSAIGAKFFFLRHRAKIECFVKWGKIQILIFERKRFLGVKIDNIFYDFLNWSKICIKMFLGMHFFDFIFIQNCKKRPELPWKGPKKSSIRGISAEHLRFKFTSGSQKTQKHTILSRLWPHVTPTSKIQHF